MSRPRKYRQIALGTAVYLLIAVVINTIACDGVRS